MRAKDVETHQALYVAAGFFGCCALFASFDYPEIPALQSLRRTAARANWILPGPQFCGRPAGRPPVGHGQHVWVVELPLGQALHCLAIYPTSAEQDRLLRGTKRDTPLVALHTDHTVWQLEGPDGVLMDYEGQVAVAQRSRSQHLVALAAFYLVTLLLLGLALALRSRSRRLAASKPSTDFASPETNGTLP